MLRNTLANAKISQIHKEAKSHDEYQYLNLISDILSEGSLEEGRNGKTLTVFGAAMHFDLTNNKIPLLTTKKVAWKTCLKELFWFIRGSTDNEELQKQNVKIWNANASRDFLDSRGLKDRKENDLGPVYGHQWRFFNAPYTNCNDDYKGQGIDQLQNIIDILKNPEERTSRRMIMSAWNPAQLDEMALPPCHVLIQFNVVRGNKLSCSLYQRSGDIGLGVPFNVASYSFLTHIIAKHCGLEPYEFIHYLGNCHIYDDHINVLQEQQKRIPYPFPNIRIKNVHDNIDDYIFEDIEIEDYISHPPIKMEMRK
jgi:thymidylate synthase